MNDEVYTLSEIKRRIEPIARDYGVEAMFLFGSYAKGTAGRSSDMDFRIDKGEVRGIRFSALRLALEDAFGKSVDLVTSQSMDLDFIAGIKDEEIQVYAK